MTEELNKAENPKQIVVEKKMTTKQKVRIILTTLLSIALITFVIQNSNRVEVDFLNLTIRIRIVYIILISALFGGLVSFLLVKRKKKK